MNYAGLLAGLGNPGQRYRRTRHNFGYMLLDFLLQEYAPAKNLKQGKIREDKQCVSCELQFELGSDPWLLCKPMLFMNNSGVAIKKMAKRNNILPQNILVVHDDLDLDFGKIRFKYNGGFAGHKGLISVNQHLGSSEFYRLRLGIGRPKDFQEPAEYVLNRLTPSESEFLPKIFEAACSGISLFCQNKIQAAMQLTHTFVL